jgi:hypothetical protein
MSLAMSLDLTQGATRAIVVMGLSLPAPADDG